MSELWILGSALLVGFEAGSALYQQRCIARSRAAILAWTVSFGTLLVLWHTTRRISLQGWWIGAGMVLVMKAFYELHHYQSSRMVLQSAWIEPLEAIGTLFVLIVGTGNIAAVIAGFIAGFVLPFGFQDWMQVLRGWGDIMRTVSLGGVGLEDLAHGLWPASWVPWPYVWWMVPWLLWWEVSDRFWRDYATAWPPKQ